MDMDLDKKEADFKARLVNKIITFCKNNKEKKSKDDKPVEFFNINDFSEIQYRKLDGDKVLIYHPCYDKVFLLNDITEKYYILE